MKVMPADTGKGVPIEFDTCKAYCPFCCSTCFLCSVSVIGIAVLPFIPCYASAYLKSQRAVMTGETVEYNDGVFSKTEKSIPYAKIQDVALRQNLVEVISLITHTCLIIQLYRDVAVPTLSTSKPLARKVARKQRWKV